MTARALDPVAKEVAVLVRAGYPLIYVVTQEENRALELVEAGARAGKRGFAIWSATRGFRFTNGETEEVTDPQSALTRLIDETEPGIFTFLDFHAYLDRPGVIRRVRDLLPDLVARRQSLVIVAPVLALPPELERDAAIIDLALPGATELRRVLDRVADTERLELDPDVADRAVRSALGLTLDEAGRVFRKVMVLQRGLGENDLVKIIDEKKRALRSSDALEFHELGESLSDVGGLGELKRWLAARTKAFGPAAREFGLPAPKGLLLLGVQGCGKSLSAKAVAELWKFPLLRLDLSAVFSGVRTSPEATIRQATKIAESLAPVVLWVDEIEKGFTAVEGDDRGARVFGSFLTWLSEKQAEVFVVATANNVAGLPPELLRRGRFDEVFFVDLPSTRERLEILKIHLQKRGRSVDSVNNVEEVADASEHFSGAELEQVVVAALYRAFAAGRELTDEDLEIAVQQTVPLYATYEERIKELRDWAKRRARPATQDSTVLDLFEDG